MPTGPRLVQRGVAYEHEALFARALVEEAGALALDFQRRGISSELKDDESPVTAADRACEQLLVSRLTERFPADGLLGEEGASRESRNGRRWIIDPIDGTKDFVRGIPLWAVLLGFEEQGDIVAGAVCSPGQRLTAWAYRGGGAFVNGQRVQVSHESDPARAILSFNGFNKEGRKALGPDLLDWVGRFWAVRSLGGANDALLVACGSADVWIEPEAKPWDLAPLKILIEEAGGTFTAFNGKPSIYEGSACAAAPGMQGAVLELLGQRK